MTLIFDHPVPGAATHALVIGVGAYQHLPGGSGTLFPDHEGLQQLTSPPVSARAFADWLLTKYCNTAKPLATLELLISDAHDQSYKIPKGATVPVIECATFQNIQAAITQKWFKRGDTNPDHLLLFFFCGHGVSRGMITSLLLEDFASWDQNPLKEAVDFRQLHSGMDRCAARQQVYFVDSCRAASAALIEKYNDYAGDPIIPPSAQYNPVGIRYAPIYYATAPGQTAYSRPHQPSIFTEVLLKALEGPGSREIDGVWQVDSLSLIGGIESLMRRALQSTRGPKQIASADGLQQVPLHTLTASPVVPVTIGCKPPQANPLAQLAYVAKGGAYRQVRAPAAADWEVEIQAGDYEFSAQFPAGGFHDKTVERFVYPPEGVCHVEVQ